MMAGSVSFMMAHPDSKFWKIQSVSTQSCNRNVHYLSIRFIYPNACVRITVNET